MLGSIELKEEYKVIDKKVYAIIKEIGTKRLIDPCEVRIELAKENDLLTKEKAELESKLAEITKQITENTILDNQIAALGYCKKDKPVYKKIDGIVIKNKNGEPVIERYTHQSYCPNKGVK